MLSITGDNAFLARISGKLQLRSWFYDLQAVNFSSFDTGLPVSSRSISALRDSALES